MMWAFPEVRMRIRSFACLSAVSLALAAGAPTLYQKPALSAQDIAFVYGGDLWVVSRSGGEARRLTSDIGLESDPAFSPDGRSIAFTGEYDGNPDVYVVPTAGGSPKRLTFHPGADTVAGWTPDGQRILFRSARASNSPRYTQLYTVSKDGGPAEPVALPMAFSGSYSADGKRLAYEPLPRAFNIWKHYRGGQASYLWVADLATGAVQRMPRGAANDYNPMWAGDRLYFISDREGSATLYSWDFKGEPAKVLENKGLDLKNASLGPGAIVYEQFGSIHLFDLASQQEHPVEIRVSSDLPGTRPHFVKVEHQILNAGISPSGARAVFEARGEILTVPAEKGDVRNLTQNPGAADRDPAWSPDGRSVACFSDRDGEYALYVQPAEGGAAKRYALGEAPGYYYAPTWSPDSRRIAYLDRRLNLWVLSLDTGANLKVDTNAYEDPARSMDPSWSPDSRWVAYTRELDSHLHAVFAFEVDTKNRLQLTDGMSDARFPVFDPNGKYLYFTASTNAGASAAWLDMSSFDRPSTASVYAMVLRRDTASPLAPESDEEKAKEPEKKVEDKGAKPEEPKAPSVAIDTEGLSQRILALPLPARNYVDLQIAKSGSLYLLSAPDAGTDLEDGPQGGLTLNHFDLAKRKEDEVASNLGGFRLAAQGEKMLLRRGGGWLIAPVDKPSDGKLRNGPMEVWTDPRAEWKQIFHEAFRMQRDFFYDAKAHGVDLKAAEAEYAPYLDAVASRDDLNYLLQEAMGRLSVGHLFLGGGDRPEPRRVGAGLLGADFSVDHGRYRFARIFDGENWNPQLRAPLTQPGATVKAGEYLLAVDGRELKADQDVYAAFDGKVGAELRLKVGPNADGSGSREITVQTVGSETALRNHAWIEGNRRRVEELGKGRVAYAYMPDTGGEGYTSFNRYFFAQVNREGLVLDERFNAGGSAANYVIDILGRKLLNYWFTRDGHGFTTPEAAIFGPKAMVINEFAGSGGDAMPWYFRHAGIGPLIGKRTWGGLVGIYDYPQLLDGGFLTAPRVAFYSPDGQWDVENHGVAADQEVELDPAAWRAGRDPQLEAAVAYVLEQLKQHPLPKPSLPSFPDYYGGKR